MGVEVGVGVGVGVAENILPGQKLGLNMKEFFLHSSKQHADYLH